MKFKYRVLALTLGGTFAIGLASTAQAVPVAGDLLEVYGNIYPQYQNSSFGDAAVGTAQSQMTRGAVTLVVLPATATPIGKNQINWVNSYIGFKGKKSFGDVTVGYDLQGSLAKDVNTNPTAGSLLADTRDAFVYAEHKQVGTLSVGQQDTVYKMFGDRVRMLGVSSSNFVSTSGLVSGVGWRSATRDGTTLTSNTATGVVTSNVTSVGVTSFNTRIGGQLVWLSPNWSGVQLGLSYRPDPNKTATQDQSLSSMGINWSNDTYYVGFGQETHKDYHPASGTNGTPATNNIVSLNPRSKDTANRISFGYKTGAIKLGADISKLKYTEEAAAGANNKFASYSTTGWQISGEYGITPQWTLAANYAKNAAGSCTLTGPIVCTTAGQGGSLLSLGGRYDLDKNIGFFALYGINTSNDSASFASSAVGGKAKNFAIGIQAKF